MKRRTRLFVLGLGIGIIFALFASMIGCSTVSGFAKDLGSMSEATRNAMTRDSSSN